MDENGKKKSDSKMAIAFTAFLVAAGAVALRMGGRAALISAIGLDFASENPQLKENLDRILEMASSLDPLAQGGLFLVAWTLVKVLCFDAGGVALALSSGILFGGVIEGAILSALCATIGSSIAFGLAKLDTPVRQKALELVNDYPSLRGIEKVVAKDGFKAILTLRLAPILPIPLGMYNYVYGVTNVPFTSFFSGIFVGSLKPYLLDSYLGYFGKTLVDGTTTTTTTIAAAATASSSSDASSSLFASSGQQLQDGILLVALGLSVLIGVFASQLATETFETVLEEIQVEKQQQREKEGEDYQNEDGIVRQFLNVDLPDWFIGFQIALAMAEDRIQEMIYTEYDAHVWNYTTKGEENNQNQSIPRNVDPAYSPTSPEIVNANQGFDFGASICDGLVLTPALFKAFVLYSDPLLDEDKAKSERRTPREFLTLVEDTTMVKQQVSRSQQQQQQQQDDSYSQEELLNKLEYLRSRTRERLNKLNERLREDEF